MADALTDTQLAAIRSDIALAASGPMIGVPAGAQRYEAWVRIGDHHGAALLAEVERLRTVNAALREQLGPPSTAGRLPPARPCRGPREQ